MRQVGPSFPLACALAALVFYLFALTAPFLEIEAYGRFALARLDTGPEQLLAQGWGLVAAAVFTVTLLGPAAKLAILLVTLGGQGWLPPRVLKTLLRWYKPVSPWAMIDVYLLGFLVAYTRLVGMAEVHLDTALYALIGCMVAMAAADGSLDIDALWHTLDERNENAPYPAEGERIGCDSCGLMNHAAEGEPCRRCNAPLRRRKVNSISRAWALVIAAAVLYIPANIYPVMVFTSLAKTHGYTIMHGIVELGQAGLWPLAVLVFFASIAIPLTKLLIMAYMLTMTQLGRTEHLLGRTHAYRLVDLIGRWSMIDVFMISILVALVRFGQFVSVQADVGAVCFAGVVVLTMFAVTAFDPRLMWDTLGPAD
jgi:paraquat-inducible protein A